MQSSSMLVGVEREGLAERFSDIESGGMSAVELSRVFSIN